MHPGIVALLIPITLFVMIGAVLILRGPLGKALGQRIAGKSAAGDRSAETEELRGEVEDLRHRLTEMEERLDFTERVLAQHRQTDPPRIKAE